MPWRNARAAHLPTARSNDDPGSYVLYEISETDGMKQVDSKPVTEQFVPGTSTGAVPCVGDELVLFGGVSDGAKGNGYGSQTLTLLKWNVKNARAHAGECDPEERRTATVRGGDELLLRSRPDDRRR